MLRTEFRNIRWTESWLKSWAQRAGISGTKPSWRLVTCGVPQGLILGPVLFSIFINDLDDGAGCTLRKFAEDRKRGGVAGTPQGWSTIKRDLDRLEKWADRNLVEFSKGRCQVLPLGRNNPKHQYMLSDKRLKSSFAENDLGDLGTG
ncbi:hypothetical protein QYF61_008666 [Mycteria americana]|uniref:Reverse transcriptase domain-containing protein n=1 Tax=Mycteria americana TaxID=33587 RepID=A0AAN7PGB7_MYCAM|nr:hypothetical protein QYF61_008666 [Mycteria americana]